MRTCASWMLRSKPRPSSRSASSTIGLSRRSSVPCLKASPSSADAARRALDEAVVDPAQVRLVGADHVLEDRHREVGAAGVVDDRAQVLGQARAAEREARPQVRARDVELRVGGEDLHHGVRVDAVGLADRAHLVGEADLERVEGVVGVLRHLGDRDRHAVDDAGKAVVERRHGVGRERVARADDGLRRIVEVAHRGALAQELRVHGDAEVVSGAQARGRLETRDQRALAGARQHRRAEDDRVAAAERRDGGADLVGDALQVYRRERAVAGRRRADADQRQVARGDGLGSVGGRRAADPPRRPRRRARRCAPRRSWTAPGRPSRPCRGWGRRRSPRARARRGRRPRRSRRSRARRLRSASSRPYSM